MPRFIRETRNPELPVILLEDTGALLGLIFALVGITLAVVTGNGAFDGLGAMAAAFEAEHRAVANGGRLADYDFIRAGAEYNEVDCRAMAEIVAWLRANR